MYFITCIRGATVAGVSIDRSTYIIIIMIIVFEQNGHNILLFCIIVLSLYVCVSYIIYDKTRFQHSYVNNNNNNSTHIV